MGLLKLEDFFIGKEIVDTHKPDPTINKASQLLEIVQFLNKVIPPKHMCRDDLKPQVILPLFDFELGIYLGMTYKSSDEINPILDKLFVDYPQAKRKKFLKKKLNPLEFKIKDPVFKDLVALVYDPTNLDVELSSDMNVNHMTGLTIDFSLKPIEKAQILLFEDLIERNKRTISICRNSSIGVFMDTEFNLDGQELFGVKGEKYARVKMTYSYFFGSLLSHVGYFKGKRIGGWEDIYSHATDSKNIDFFASGIEVVPRTYKKKSDDYFKQLIETGVLFKHALYQYKKLGSEYKRVVAELAKAKSILRKKDSGKVKLTEKVKKLQSERDSLKYELKLAKKNGKPKVEYRYRDQELKNENKRLSGIEAERDRYKKQNQEILDGSLVLEERIKELEALVKEYGKSNGEREEIEYMVDFEPDLEAYVEKRSIRDRNFEKLVNLIVDKLSRGAGRVENVGKEKWGLGNYLKIHYSEYNNFHKMEIPFTNESYRASLTYLDEKHIRILRIENHSDYEYTSNKRNGR